MFGLSPSKNPPLVLVDATIDATPMACMQWVCSDEDA
jgi:hypothetical protein